MKAPREQVLEQALRQVLGATQDDLSWRVVSAWRQGDTIDSRRAIRRFRRWRWLLAAAACAALVVSVARPWASDAVVVTADPPVLVADPGRWQPSAASRVAGGQTIAAERTAALEWPDGTRADLAAGTILRLVADDGGPRLRLLHGEVALSCGSASPCVVTIDRTSIVAAPLARLDVRTVGGDPAYEAALRSFSNLTEELHMNRLAPAAVAAVTLLSGTAVLHDASGTAPLAHGRTVTTSQDPSDAWRDALAKQAGTWDLTITDYGGATTREHVGSEVCRVPSGGRWLISDMTATRRDGSATWAHTVLGFLRRRAQWTGTFVDNFGGPIALLGGPIGDDPDVQVLTMRRADGGDFGIRTTMRWIGDDERRTEVETEVDGEWQRLRVVVHRRRK